METAIRNARTAAGAAWLRVLRVPAHEDLMRLTDLEVADLYQRKGHHRRVATLVASEMDRRDRDERAQRRRDRAAGRRQAQRDAFDLYVRNEVEHAAEWCRGADLLTGEAVTAGIRAPQLWEMPWHRAIRLATPELVEWWGMHGRLTFGEYKRQARERRPDRTEALAA
jgi:hypothetical protein